MTKVKLLILFILTSFICSVSQAQVILNELSNKNSGQITDEDNELEDWIEIYNPSALACNLSGYYLSDDSLNFEKWAFPTYQMASGKHLVVFASGKNRTVPPETYHWESPVLPEQIFDYTVPTASTPTNWMQPNIILTGWKKGKAGFGYGDNDDLSVVPDATMAVYIRKSFSLAADFSYHDVKLHIDFDDGFVVYLNGFEIARKWINGTPTWNSAAFSPHEATMYSGGKPENIAIDTTLIKSLLITGKNVLAIEVHNYLSNSGDLSLIPFLSFKISDSKTYFDPSPSFLAEPKPTNLHTNFKISSQGEKIYLFNKKTNSKETVWLKNLLSGWSTGRITDGSSIWGIFTQPTPSLANTTKSYSTEREPEPSFSIPEGYYTTKQTIGLTTTSLTAEIRYTTDGSEPIATSTLYSGTPISVLATSIIRATCFSKTNKLPGRSGTNTYFINNSGHSVPVLSVITDKSNLYGKSGIFENTGQEWEKPCYVEYFDANKQKKFEQFSGIQIDGGAGGSRSNPQHSFRLEFSNKIYGESDVNYKLIADRPDRTKYKSIYLRNGSNQWMTFQFKDAMECEMMANNTNNYYSHCTPTVVYINGAYFGVYEMREKLNDEYFQENYDAKIDENFTLLSYSYYFRDQGLRALNGKIDAFNSDHTKFMAMNTSATDFLQKADQILDLQYYTDYIVAQSWIADTDWPFNNIKIVKGDFTNNRWRFILQDLEWSLNPNGWSNSNFDHIEYMLSDKFTSGPYIGFWKNLIKNQTYKNQFINRFADIMNTSYLPENTTAIAQSVYDDSYPEMRAEYVQWGGGEAQAEKNMKDYTNNLTIFKSELTNRSKTVRDNIVTNFGLAGQYMVELQVQPENAGVIQINTISPEVYPWTGTYFSGVPIRMEAKGTGNYVFDGWEANAIIKDVRNPVIDADVKISGYKFIAKFRLQTPEDAIVISEINYNSGEAYPAGDWIELYNYGSTAKDLNNWYFTDSDPSHKWVIDGTIILQPNERLVLASDLTKFSAVYPNVKNVLGSFGFGLGTPNDFPQIYSSAGSLVAGVNYSSLAPWPGGAVDKGMTLELKDVTLNLSSASNWFDGCIGGSPGSAYSKCTIAGNDLISSISQARLYPNPASDMIHIILPSVSDNQGISCRVYDVMGKEVKTKPISGDLQNTIQIEISNFRSGIYVVKLSGENFQQSLKFIKR
jgi:hypothetical protein